MADESPLGPRDWAIVLIVCAAAIFTQTIDSDTITYRTTPPSQPLVKISCAPPAGSYDLRRG